MDGSDHRLDNPDLARPRAPLGHRPPRHLPPPVDAAIPIFALYGERAQTALDEPIHCESIAERSRLHAWEIAPHRHERLFQFLYLRAGGVGEALLDGARLPLAPPCALTVPPQVVHGFRFSPDVDGVVITVVERHLAGLHAAAPGLDARLARPRWCALADDPIRHARLEQACAAFVDEFRGAAPWRGAALHAALAQLLVEMGRAPAAGDAGLPAAAARREQVLSRFRALVERHYRSHRPVGAYAAELGLTTTHLNRLCRAGLARSALGVIADRLVLEAERDLAYTTLGVKQVALGLGFADAAYFTRFFAHRTGRTPTAFRAAARREGAGRQDAPGASSSSYNGGPGPRALSVPPRRGPRRAEPDGGDRP
jgi:AraC family transcriptional activator of pobA